MHIHPDGQRDDFSPPTSHEPNPEPPSADPTFTVLLPRNKIISMSVNDLRNFKRAVAEDCYIVSTGHGTSGPYCFGGASLIELIDDMLDEHTFWSQAAVMSSDGFGTLVHRRELTQCQSLSPILLAYEIDGKPLTRKDGLIRLIVPGENEDALRQVKWIAQITVLL